jgi:hypothetical protein
MVWARLDRILINSAFLFSMPTVKVSHLARQFSDHRPLLFMAQPPSSRHKPFRFLRMWIEHDNLKDFLYQQWQSSVPN